MFSSISSIVQLVLAGAVGLLVGVLVVTLFSREPKQAAENPLPKELTNEGYSEAVRLLYSPSTKKVVTRLDGDYYRDFMQLTPEQKKRVMRLLQGWNEWAGQKTGGSESEKSADSTPPAFPVAKEEEILPKTALDKGVFSDVDLIVKQSLGQELPKSEKLTDLGIEEPQIIEPVPAVVKIGQPAVAAPKKEPLTIVEQINEEIEKLAAGTPQEARRIHLADNGHQGVVVWVGVEHFEDVDAVPYPEVKQLLKAAVARWEEGI